MQGNSGLYFSRADYPSSWIHSNTDEQRDQEKFAPPNSASQLPCRIPWRPVPEKMHRNSARTRHSDAAGASVCLSLRPQQPFLQRQLQATSSAPGCEAVCHSLFAVVHFLPETKNCPFAEKSGENVNLWVGSGHEHRAHDNHRTN